jgi:DNA invertase Pin-like site-specific DNA recombinase
MATRPCRLLGHCCADDGVYNPNDFNDRLVLGMKGTMSDAERHMLRKRLNGGKEHKARKGELVSERRHRSEPPGATSKRLGVDPILTRRIEGIPLRAAC